MKIDELDLHPKIKQILKEKGYSTLYPPQEEAVKKGLLKGRNLVVSAPTASGKTLIAELAMLKKAYEERGKVLYLTPLRALAYEKYDEFKLYEKLGLKVGLTTGDYDSSDPWLSEYDIIVTTNEKADSLVRHRAPWLKDVKLVVADEIHLISNVDRGPTLEMFIARLFSEDRDIQILALSATIKNAGDIASWLNGTLVKSNWRPVPLKEGVFYDKVIYFNDGSVKDIHGREPPVVSLTLDTLKEGGQVLIFSNTRLNAMATAKRIEYFMREILSRSDKRDLREISKNVLSVEPNRIGKMLARLIEGGVAFHHAGLSYGARRILEKAFRENIVKVIVATPTLAAGVNLPARRVIISSYRRYNVELGYYDLIPVLEYKQMAGRAGRPKYDKYGESVLIAKTMDEFDMLMNEYVKAEPEAIVSKLSVEKALRSHILATVAMNMSISKAKLADIFSHTFFSYQFGINNIMLNMKRSLTFLIEHDMVLSEDSILKATPLGIRVSQLYIDPYSAVIIRDMLKSVNPGDIISYLFSISQTPDMPKLYVRRGEREKYLKFFYSHADRINVALPQDEYDEYIIASFMKTSLLIMDWINELPEDAIIEKYNVGSGDIYNITQSAEWLLYASLELSKTLGYIEHIIPLSMLRTRVKYGVKEELLELVKIPGIGRVRARMLYRYGFKTLDDLRKASLNDLRSVPLIGPEIAKSIKNFLEGGKEENLLTLPDRITLDTYL